MYKQLITILLSSNLTTDSFQQHIQKAIEEGAIKVIDFVDARSIIKSIMFPDQKKQENKDFEQFIKDEVLSEIEGMEMFNGDGFVIKQKETGVKYSYPKDEVHKELTEQIKELSKELKARETFLKSISPTKLEPTYETTEDGELVQVYAPVKQSTTSYSITRKRNS